jgi:hypothetical protein
VRAQRHRFRWLVGLVVGGALADALVNMHYPLALGILLAHTSYLDVHTHAEVVSSGERE